MANSKSKGFTLIELIIVIAILGILAGIAIPRFLDAQAAARGSRIVADLRTIDSAATIYYAKNGKYPDAITTATPATTDGFIGANLAAWPTPNIGTFIVMQVTGSEKTFKDVTAANYTLTSEGRAQYDGHTVEYYLGMSSESNNAGFSN
jgi:prepilin-type N-terminal cleavage/methylation domain-containing protein